MFLGLQTGRTRIKKQFVFASPSPGCKEHKGIAIFHPVVCLDRILPHHLNSLSKRVLFGLKRGGEKTRKSRCFRKGRIPCSCDSLGHCVRSCCCSETRHTISPPLQPPNTRSVQRQLGTHFGHTLIQVWTQTHG